MESVLVHRCVLPRPQGQYSWAVIFLSSRNEGHAAGCDSPPVSWPLRTAYVADKSKERRLFSLHIS